MGAQNFLFSFFLALGIYATTAIAYSSESNIKGVWWGIEVMGGEEATAKLIRSLLPIKQGMAFVSSKNDEYHGWCRNIQKHIKDSQVQCNYIVFLDGKTYYTVEIVKPGSNFNYRKIPLTKRKPKIPTQLQNLLEKWETEFYRLFEKGIDPQESFENGYLDYKDPTLHQLSKKITQLAHKHSNILLDVIEYSPDPQSRSDAATLLSWSRRFQDFNIVIEKNLFRDPDEDVRNNLSRSFSLSISRLSTPSLKKAIPVMCEQLAWPSSTDRNKSLATLNEILKIDSKFSLEISKECRASLKYIAQNSILPNIGGTAMNILSVINRVENEKDSNNHRET